MASHVSHRVTEYVAGPLQRSAAVLVAASTVAGVLVGAVVSVFTVPQAAALIGWDVAASLYVGSTYLDIWRLDAGATRERATRLDPRRVLADVLVVAAGVAILAAVGLALARAGQAHGGLKAYLLTVGIISVALSWLAVQTVFVLRYAGLYYGGEPGGPGGIDFNEPEPPDYHDFAYVAFTIGMTFQVSDTDLTDKAVRRTALRQALISYLFGAVTIALVINIVASLL